MRRSGSSFWARRVATEWLQPPDLDYGQPRTNPFHHRARSLHEDEDDAQRRDRSLLQIDRLSGGGGMTRPVAENHCRADRSTGATVGPPGHAGHRVPSGEQARYRLLADVQDAAVGVGARSALVPPMEPMHVGTA